MSMSNTTPALFEFLYVVYHCTQEAVAAPCGDARSRQLSGLGHQSISFSWFIFVKPYKIRGDILFYKKEVRT